MFKTTGLIDLIISDTPIAYHGETIQVSYTNGSAKGDMITNDPNEALNYVAVLESQYCIITKRSVLMYSKLRTLAAM